MDGQVKAISLQGIVRNETKIGVQDGQCEDLVNLRFKDGSWRTADGGKYSFAMPGGYSQLFIHTNVYKHLLGVKNGNELYWIGTIERYTDDDGVEKERLVGTATKITDVSGDVSITQNGHLITVIDGQDDFEYFVFKTGDNKYYAINVDVNGEQSDRTIFPYGYVHFNIINNNNDPGDDNKNTFLRKIDDIDCPTMETAHAEMISLYDEAVSENKFTDPFLAVVAIELYDGSYVYASAPTLIYPRQFSNCENKKFYDPDSSSWVQSGNDKQVVYLPIKEVKNTSAVGYGYFGHSQHYTTDIYTYRHTTQTPKTLPNYGSCWHAIEEEFASVLYTSDITLSLGSYEILDKNKGLFSSVCVFITKPSSIHYMDMDGYKKSKYLEEYEGKCIPYLPYYSNIGIEQQLASYPPEIRTNDEIIYDLMHSNFYLLKRFASEELKSLEDNPLIDLSKPEDKGRLKAICSGAVQEILTAESFSREYYIPKVAYSYNGRLHIANYETKLFHGFPVEQFTLNGHSVRIEDDAVFKSVLDNLTGNDDEYLQYTRNDKTLYSDEDLTAAQAPVLISVVEVNDDSGTQVVSRVILSGDNDPTNSVEDIGPFLSFPDSRATKMTIYYVESRIQSNDKYTIKKKEFKLVAHPYLNLAYYIEPELKPIKFSDFSFVEANPVS